MSVVRLEHLTEVFTDTPARRPGPAPYVGRQVVIGLRPAAFAVDPREASLVDPGTGEATTSGAAETTPAAVGAPATT